MSIQMPVSEAARTITHLIQTADFGKIRLDWTKDELGTDNLRGTARTRIAGVDFECRARNLDDAARQLGAWLNHLDW